MTTAQAALMLMKALGYFQYASDFGSDWQLATTRQGNAIDLFVGVDSGVTAPMTRDDVAQLVLNTLAVSYTHLDVYKRQGPAHRWRPPSRYRPAGRKFR